MPEAITKQLWEDKDSKDNTINLAAVVPTSIPDGYRFVGWSHADGENVIATKYNAYRFLKNETLYAVWEELEAPTVTDKVSIPHPRRSGYALHGQCQHRGNAFRQR